LVEVETANQITPIQVQNQQKTPMAAAETRLAVLTRLRAGISMAVDEGKLNELLV
jgi:hypothetical protein